MKAVKKRQLAIKELNRELKLYLRAYDRTHPHYKRNIRNLYEGLVDLGILDHDHSLETFRKFEIAFKQADKGLKMAMITSHLFNNPRLGQFFEYQGRPIQGVKMIGGIFVSKQPSKLLNEREYLNYLQKAKEKGFMQREKEDLDDLRKGLEQLFDDKMLRYGIKDKIQLTKEEIAKFKQQKKEVERVTKKYGKEIQKIAQTYGLEKDDALLQKLQEVEDYREFREQLLAETSGIQYLVEHLLKQKQLEVSRYEEFMDKQMSNIKLKDDIDTEEIKNLTEALKYTQAYVQEEVQPQTEEGVPDVVKPLTDVINLRNQLKRFIALLSEKRTDLNDPGDIIEYVSPRRKSKNPVAATLGEGMEGFAMREFKNLHRRLDAYFELFNKYSDLIPDGNLKNAMYDLVNGLFFLVKDFENVPAFFEQQLDPDGPFTREEFTGRIANIDQHPRTMELVRKIQDEMGKDMANAQKALAESETMISFNKGLIKQAEIDRRGVRQTLSKLEKAELELNKLLLRKDIRNKENE